MTKKIFLILLIAALSTAGVMAQEASGEPAAGAAQEGTSAVPAPMDEKAAKAYEPMNTITVDFGPTIIGGAFKIVGSILNDSTGIKSSGFGIGAQYERQITEEFTVTGRFSYLGIGMEFSTGEGLGENLEASADASVKSFSLEAHVRYYLIPEFFLDGMLGYGNISIGINGRITGDNDELGIKERKDANLSISRHYIKYGAKLGFRFDFGKPGGFVFEPALGFYGAIGLGDTMGKKLTKKMSSNDGNDVDYSGLDLGFAVLEHLIFIGGPRMTVSFGWRF
jgi:hypothetical protein